MIFSTKFSRPCLKTRIVPESPQKCVTIFYGFGRCRLPAMLPGVHFALLKWRFGNIAEGANERPHSRRKRPLSPCLRTRSYHTHTLKAAQTGFLRRKQRFSYTISRRPLRRKPDKAVCGTAGALLPISAKALRITVPRGTLLRKSTKAFLGLSAYPHFASFRPLRFNFL